MLKVGLTGGMGSGKSTVAKIFAVLGVPVYDADTAAKRLMVENEEVKAGIKKLFGEESYRDGILNRQHISAIAFSDPKKLTALNAIVHPATLDDARNWMASKNSNYIIKEAALIFEAGAQKDLDLVIGVSSPIDLRLARIMKRDNASREDVLARMDRQMEESLKMKLCDFVMVNDEVQPLLAQVLALHEKLNSGNLQRP